MFGVLNIRRHVKQTSQRRTGHVTGGTAFVSAVAPRRLLDDQRRAAVADDGNGSVLVSRPAVPEAKVVTREVLSGAAPLDPPRPDGAAEAASEMRPCGRDPVLVRAWGVA